ncbi:hypothetical protein [Pseudomonas aeruginosa]|uniref:hypothetical protein n=1 Tax=Pseudomonas aeruginosa TaxID=287 RepID=UPI000F88AA14|nr:hypothetical protein [Pseudomonas aeruginosa]NPW01296.1 hypothetical protein [Pseudomonas aeruginosa]RMJ69506.1 hypothetical protein IPC1269_27260 [Pseudomonas aeruginosa]RPL46591.1 hypothetical protein IPC1469_29565 [Pseudomonas aeruginosa]RUC29756.1 hypothetical protein IPC1399_12070 [Pseudomonas aeruginosa]RUC42228.1 hypothetical protein IPC1390_06610 [Pseudomonas aeruginosa]
MPKPPLPALLYRLNLNINAIGSAVEELAIWVEQRGSTETSDSVKLHLETLIENANFIAEALVELTAQEAAPDPD